MNSRIGERDPIASVDYNGCFDLTDTSHGGPDGCSHYSLAIKTT